MSAAGRSMRVAGVGRVVEIQSWRYGFVVPHRCAGVSLTVAIALPCQSCAGVSDGS